MDSEKQIHAIVIFGDIKNFGVYFHRVTNSEKELLPFFRLFDELIDEFEHKTKYFIKRLGDGFMCVVEIPESNYGPKTMRILEHVFQFGKKINQIIKRMPTPRPDGFRIRVASGYIWEIRRSNNRQDYLGYHVNLCEKMLELHKEFDYVCCQNVKENTPVKEVKSHGFKFVKLGNNPPISDSVYKIDMNSLWAFTKGA